MKFLIHKWTEKVIKAALTALVAQVTGPKVMEVLSGLGVTVDPVQAQAGLWVALIALTNWAKHQAWMPSPVRKLL